MNIIIAGCRTFNDYDRLKSELDELFINYEDHEITIISGECRGTDLLGERYANEKGYKIEKHPADWDTYGKSAGYIRNAEMAKISRVLMAFWDYQSPGTKHMIDLAEKQGLEIHIIDIRGTLYTCSINGLKTIKEDTIKLLIARKPLNNMQKYGINHVIQLAPSVELFNDMHNKKITWKQYVVRYRQEMVKNMQPTLDKIEKYLMEGKSISLICYCTNSNECHRKLLGNYFKELGYEVILM